MKKIDYEKFVEFLNTQIDTTRMLVQEEIENKNFSYAAELYAEMDVYKFLLNGTTTEDSFELFEFVDEVEM